MISYEDENFITIDDDKFQGGNNISPSTRDLSPNCESNNNNGNRRENRTRSRSRSYDDRSRRSNGNHRSRSPRNRSRDRFRRSDNTGRTNRSTAHLDRELGLKYRWEKTVYVSNIPYETRWTDLKDLFRSKVGDIMYCEVFEKDYKSLGVGAIEFKTVDDAERAVKVMHQYELGGRKISCRIDNEGYKTRQAKEQSVDSRNSKSSSSHNSSNSNNNGENSQATALALASTLASLAGNSNNNGNLLTSLLGIANPIVTAPNTGLLGSFANGMNGQPQNSVLNQLAAQLKVDGPVTNRIFVASLDYKVDESKLKEVFQLAGNVQQVSLFRDRDQKSRGMAVVEYDTQLEALNAVAMFNNQTLMDRQMTVRFDTKPPRDDDPPLKSGSGNGNSSKLPSGLKSIGTGIGINGLLGSSQPTNGLSALISGLSNQVPDLSSLTNLGINLNGTAPSLMSGLLGTSNTSSNGLLNNYNGNQSKASCSSNNTISKIFVKNIPFSWDDRRLKEKFRQAGQIEHAEIKSKDGKSRGCGLIRFSSPEQAVKAVELFNGSRFEGRTLEVKLDQM